LADDSTATPPPEARTIADLFVNRAGDDRVGLVFEGEEWTWAEVVAECAARAAMLRDTGLAGKHIGVLLDNTPEYLFFLGAVALSGSVLVGANHTRRGAALANDIDHTDVAVLYTDSTKSDIIDGFALPVPVVLVDGADFLDQVARYEGAALPPPEELPEPDDLFLLIFTSGSTGAPKAVRMSHAKAIGFGRGGRRLAELGTRRQAEPAAAPANAAPANAAPANAAPAPPPAAPSTPDAATMQRLAAAYGPNAVFYNSMPMYHTNALTASVFAALRTGAKIVFKRRFSASSWLSDIRSHGVTNFNYVGRSLSYILAQPETPEDSDNRLVAAAGSEATLQDRQEFERRFGVALPLSEGYTSSEEGINIAGFPGMPEGALGRPFPGQDVIVADVESGEECAPAVFGPGRELLNPNDAIGELVRRDSLGSFEGYYANDEANAERTRNGWFWSGDLGYRDDDGIIYFAGRGIDWIRVDSENFAAGPIDRILARHPDVTGAVAYAVPDPHNGDRVMVALELRAGTIFDSEAFAGFLADQPDLGTKWSPHFVRIVEAIPETANGKVDRKPLRAQRWQVDDPVWYRPGRELDYRLLTPEDVAEIERQFAAHGRSGALH
jgi:fatty-acyl-CoA synthase